MQALGEQDRFLIVHEKSLDEAWMALEYCKTHPNREAAKHEIDRAKTSIDYWKEHFGNRVFHLPQGKFNPIREFDNFPDPENFEGVIYLGGAYYDTCVNNVGWVLRLRDKFKRAQIKIVLNACHTLEWDDETIAIPTILPDSVVMNVVDDKVLFEPIEPRAALPKT